MLSAAGTACFLWLVSPSVFLNVLVVLQAPGSNLNVTYVDVPPATVPPEASYEEDWEVFDP